MLKLKSIFSLVDNEFLINTYKYNNQIMTSSEHFTMDLFIYYVIIAFLGTVLQKSSCLSIPWNNHVYTGRHFDDYVTATQVGHPDVIRPALLILYSPACENNIWFLKEKMLPPEKYFVLAKHDYETFPKHIWYKLDKRDNLSQRYKPRNCPEFLFFRNGSTTLSPERYNPYKDPHIIAWIWERLRIYFTVSNSRDQPISVYINATADHEELSIRFVSPHESELVYAYISDIISVRSGATTIYANVVDSAFPHYIAITKETVFDSKFNLWLTQTKKLILKESLKTLEWRTHIAYFYLLNFKQPLLLPRFTKTGYKKGHIPPAVYQEILGFYNNNIKNRRKEKNRVEPAINDKEVKCSMVYLTDEMIHEISQSMLPLMESWCDCRLEQTTVYGIREYYRGNILRNHVDRISTHIISVILQVHKELGDQPDWPLEIIDMNGQTQQIYLQSGEMLFYESSTLIHGRPTPFKGNLFANAFLHYRPIDSWGWDFVDGYVAYNDEQIDHMSTFTDVDIERGKSFHHFNIPLPRDEF